ncbi:MAG TPA: hypothetical protein VF483_13605, partial [Gemmatimonadaceae bacterium]
MFGNKPKTETPEPVESDDAADADAAGGDVEPEQTEDLHWAARAPRSSPAVRPPAASGRRRCSAANGTCLRTSSA